LVVDGKLAANENCCCTPPKCSPIVSWEIIDLTGGTAEVLRSGNVTFEDIIEDPYGII
jgi:tRNA A37 threonylcarbamoyladenosine synthetase subunit TsaC/SUA5/YrdC